MLAYGIKIMSMREIQKKSENWIGITQIIWRLGNAKPISYSYEDKL